MGKASSRKKYARATRSSAKRRRGASGPPWLAIVMVLIVALGVGAIVASRSDRQEASGKSKNGPAPGDHLHAAIGYNICGSWQPPLPDTSQQRFDLHTHEDGIIHMEPKGSAFAYGRATVANFLSPAGASVSETSIKLPGIKKSNGDKCDGKPGKVRWSVNGEERTGDPGKFVGKDGDMVMLAFLPDGQEIGTAPGAAEALAEQTGQMPVVPPVSPDAPVPSDPSAPADPLVPPEGSGIPAPTPGPVSPGPTPGP